MDKSQFYSSSRHRPTTRRFRTLIQALDKLQEYQHDGNIVILPPDAGYRAVDSDVEETDNNQLNEESLHEQAGEVEVELSDEVSHNDSSESDDEPLSKKIQENRKSKIKMEKEC